MPGSDRFGFIFIGSGSGLRVRFICSALILINARCDIEKCHTRFQLWMLFSVFNYGFSIETFKINTSLLSDENEIEKVSYLEHVYW